MHYTDLNSALLAAYKEYLTYGERSNKKLIPLHSFIAESLQNRLGEEFQVNSLGHGTNKEEELMGALYDKRVDIAVLKDGTQVGAIAVKFVASNYSQNANNYFENMIGETFNLRSGNIVYSQFFVLKNPIPYLGKNKTVEKIEHINNDRILKYKKLLDMNIKQFGVPNSLLFKLVDTGDSYVYEKYIDTEFVVKDEGINQELLQNCKIVEVDIDTIVNIDDEVKSFYNQHSNFENFITHFVELIHQKIA